MNNELGLIPPKQLKVENHHCVFSLQEMELEKEIEEELERGESEFVAADSDDSEEEDDVDVSLFPSLSSYIFQNNILINVSMRLLAPISLYILMFPLKCSSTFPYVYSAKTIKEAFNTLTLNDLFHFRLVKKSAALKNQKNLTLR